MNPSNEIRVNSNGINSFIKLEETKIEELNIKK